MEPCYEDLSFGTDGVVPSESSARDLDGVAVMSRPAVAFCLWRPCAFNEKGRVRGRDAWTQSLGFRVQVV